jgi:hypothetical protein
MYGFDVFNGGLANHGPVLSAAGLQINHLFSIDINKLISMENNVIFLDRKKNLMVAAIILQ